MKSLEGPLPFSDWVTLSSSLGFLVTGISEMYSLIKEKNKIMIVELKRNVLEDGIIDAQEVKELEEIMYEDGIDRLGGRLPV